MMDETIFFLLSENSNDIFIDYEYFEQYCKQSPNPFVDAGLKLTAGINLFLFDGKSIEILEKDNADIKT